MQPHQQNTVPKLHPILERARRSSKPPCLQTKNLILPVTFFISKYNEIWSLYTQDILIFRDGSKQNNHTATCCGWGFLFPLGQCYQWCTTGLSDRTYFLPAIIIIIIIIFMVCSRLIDDVTLAYPGTVRYKLFADDLKIYSNVDSSCASLNLHTALCELERWCQTWQLQVNLSKSKTSVVHLGASSPRVSYSFNNSTVCTIIRDLGVIVDSGLTCDAMLIMLFLKHMLALLCYLEGFLHEILLYYAEHTQRMSVLYILGYMLPMSRTLIFSPRESEAVCFYRRWFVCLTVCLCVCLWPR